MHLTHSYILNPVHQITVDLVGLGGTGSQVLSGIARINQSLLKLGHPGLHVRAWDPDRVTDANIGRQLFSPADLGQNKSLVLVTRINRFFGFDWEAVPEPYNGTAHSNIIITCVDTAKTRLSIAKRLSPGTKKTHPTNIIYYWLDLGNNQHTGQCVIGTVTESDRWDKKPYTSLQTVTKRFDLSKIKEDTQGPSCSLAEALEKQDLFINSTLAQFGCNLIWKLIREGVINYQGCFVNLQTLTVNPIRIK